MDLLFVNVAHADVDSLVKKVDTLIVNPIIVFLFALAIVYFLYGMIEFLSNAENEEKRTDGRNHMIYSIIGIVVMMGVFTILNVIINTFNDVQNSGTINPEQGTVHLNNYTPPSTGSVN